MFSIHHKDFGCLLNMLDACKKIHQYAGKYDSADDFYNNTLSFDATMMNFIVIGEIADKLSEEFLE